MEDDTRHEMQHLAWTLAGERVANNVSVAQLHALLEFTLAPEDLPRNPVNDARDELIKFIEEHRNQLSLPCQGTCYEHCDGIVLWCYAQLKEDNG